MKLTFKEITNAYAALKSLNGGKFDFNLSLKIDKMESELTKPAEAFRKREYDLIIKYGAYNEETKQTKVTDENFPTYLKEINEDLSLEEEVAINPIKASLFEKYEVPKGFSSAMGKCIDYGDNI